MNRAGRKRSWALPEAEATPEGLFQERRAFLKGLGLAALGTAGLISGATALGRGSLGGSMAAELGRLRRLPAPGNGVYKLDRPVTEEVLAAEYNNFYEFSTGKSGISELTKDFQRDPWRVEVGGLVERPRTFGMEELLREMPLEERLYRFRCVEAWAMAVPWVGFPFSALLKKVGPLSSARYIRMTAFFQPDQAPRQKKGLGFWRNDPWPYTEGLTMAEAMNELTLLTVGSYGHILPKQHGAPIRLIVPWKYGFKNVKSIVKIELTAKKPATFWNTLAPKEYGFTANVNPAIPHPRWSQKTERLLGVKGRRPTLPYNGYGEYVQGLYSQPGLLSRGG